MLYYIHLIQLKKIKTASIQLSKGIEKKMNVQVLKKYDII